METEETLPFPPPFTRLLSLQRRELASCTQLPGAPSLEQLTEARLAELASQGFLWQTPPPRSGELVLASANTGQQMVLAAPEPQRALPLRWRGQAVSEELQMYALRVARGEDLAPYRGPILADASLEPWVAAEVRPPRKAARSGARPLLLLAALATLAAFVLPSLQADLPELEQSAAVAPAPAQPAAATPALTQLASLQTEPSPQGESVRAREPLEPPGAGPREGAASSPVPGAAAAAASIALPSTSSAAPKLRAEAPARAPQPGAPDPALATPSTESAGPSMLLVDEPSF